MIVVKLICTKSESGELEVVRREPLTQGDFESAAFQSKREEYATKKVAYNWSLMELDLYGTGAWGGSWLTQIEHNPEREMVLKEKVGH